MLDLFPMEVFKNSGLIWLDPCAGKGNYFICLYYRLLESLKDEIPNIETRKSHIIENMFYMIEINKQHIDYLKILFGENANIYEKDFLLETKKYDVTNTSGIVQVSCNVLDAYIFNCHSDCTTLNLPTLLIRT